MPVVKYGGTFSATNTNTTMHPHLIPQNNALAFFTGGKSLFTLRSVKTGTRFTYRMNVPKSECKEDPKIIFVEVLTGPDNESDYRYIGFVRKNGNNWEFFYGKASKIKADAPNVIAFSYVFNNIAAGRCISNLEVWHEGKCCRCGRTLTDPSSIESGIGPECATRKQKFLKKLAEKVGTTN